jgi:hypothetical protein
MSERERAPRAGGADHSARPLIFGGDRRGPRRGELDCGGEFP